MINTKNLVISSKQNIVGHVFHSRDDIDEWSSYHIVHQYAWTMLNVVLTTLVLTTNAPLQT